MTNYHHFKSTIVLKKVPCVNNPITVKVSVALNGNITNSKRTAYLEVHIESEKCGIR